MTAGNQLYSDIVEIARRNGDFKRNYGTIVGAFLYLRSLRAARGRSICWMATICAMLASAPWLEKLGRWLPTLARQLGNP